MHVDPCNDFTSILQCTSCVNCVFIFVYCFKSSMYNYVPRIIDVHTIYNLCLSIHDIDKQLVMYGQLVLSFTLQETNISPKNGILKMIFLFPRWDMLIPSKVYSWTFPWSTKTSPNWNSHQQLFRLFRCPSRGIPPHGPHALKLGWSGKPKSQRICNGCATTRWKATKAHLLCWWILDDFRWFSAINRYTSLSLYPVKSGS